MVDILFFVLSIFLILQAFVGLTFFVSCVWEKEQRAVLYAGLQFAGMLFPVFLVFYLKSIGFFYTVSGTFVLIAGLFMAAAIVYFFCRKTEHNQRAIQGTSGYVVDEVAKTDEREHVFARNRSLKPYSEQYKQFYKKHPHMEQGDANRRAKGGPIGTPGIIDRPNGGSNVAATLASLNMSHYLSDLEKVKPKAHMHCQGNKIELRPGEASARIKGYTRQLGACMVGIAKINPLWVYSHRGEIFHENWEDWGAQINVDHDFAIVFAEEMSFDMVGTAPHTPTTLESMNNYARGAYISSQLASFIANLGYSATANHLRHYDTLLVPLAVDAGLGEMGRLGYLLTRKYGARIRLSAVTTNLPLVPDKPVDIGVEDFCRICKKCANCCPSNSIPTDDDQTVVNGTLRWKLNAETCFDYWGKVGTDCNVCMRVCPWSHADTFPHRLIKFMVTRNRHARRMFNLMDDVFYGKSPKPKPGPRWSHYLKPKG